MSKAPIDWDEMRRRLAAARAGLERGFEPPAAEVERRLRARAAALAQRPDPVVDESDHLSLLEFKRGDMALAVESRWVREVVADGQLVPVPCTPAFLSGVFYLRGQIVSALDFPLLLGLPAPEPATHLVIIGQEERTLGLVAGTVAGMTQFRRDKLDPVPGGVQNGRQYFLGVTDTGSVLLDGAIFFNDDENGFSQAGLG